MPARRTKKRTQIAEKIWIPTDAEIAAGAKREKERGLADMLDKNSGTRIHQVLKHPYIKVVKVWN